MKAVSADRLAEGVTVGRFAFSWYCEASIRWAAGRNQAAAISVPIIHAPSPDSLVPPGGMCVVKAVLVTVELEILRMVGPSGSYWPCLHMMYLDALGESVYSRRSKHSPRRRPSKCMTESDD